MTVRDRFSDVLDTLSSASGEVSLDGVSPLLCSVQILF